MIFGLPYKGSKNTIAQHIIDMLPPADHFYDLFGGGGAVSHCAALSGKFKYIHYNELSPIVYECFVNSCRGFYKEENRWISRTDFNKLKSSDAYAAFCFSFGNNLRGYAYGEEIEEYKKSLHYSIFFDDNKHFAKYFNLNDFKYSSEIISLRYKEIIQFIKTFKPERKMIELQSLEALKRLQSLQGLNLICSCRSYDALEIEEDSVIYCDPHYINTDGYLSDFNHKKFYSWCKKQRNIFISEYTMPDDFLCLGAVNKNVILDRNNKAKKKQEKLFTNNHYEERFILC